MHSHRRWMIGTKIPFLVVGITVAAYWLRVLAMARKAHRRTGRAANFLPPEPIGRALRIIWIPAVTAWIAAPFLAAADAHPTWLLAPLYHLPALQTVAAAIVVSAFILTLLCWRAMGRAWRMGIDPNERNPLVTGGPFAIVRHPIYALSTLMMLSTVLATGSTLILLAAAIHIPLLQWESHREERHMRNLYGPEYDQYCRSVNRWMPRPGAIAAACRPSA